MYDSDEREGRGIGGIAVKIAATLAVAALGWVLVSSSRSPAVLPPASALAPTTVDGSAASAAGDGDAARAATAPDGPPTTNPDPDPDTAAAATTPTTTPTTTTTRATTTTVEIAGRSDGPSAGTPSDVPDPFAPLPAGVPAAGAPDPGPASDPADAAATDAGYPTLPDGTPAPIIAVYDVDTITLSGAVPSESDIARLETLALVNNQHPGATLVDELTVDPDVPATIGVRVIEKTSVRFPAGSATVLPAHAAELDRVAALMGALDHVTVLVVGHADQRGSDVANFAISDQRARNVVTYLVSAGIEPSRLSSRAVGEADLLSLDDDATALALNRRTEFIFYGLLVAG